MRNPLLLFLFLLSLTTLAGCGPEVTFSSPQPEGLASLTKYPKELQGRYQEPLSNDSNEWMEVGENAVVTQEAVHWRLTKEQLSAHPRFRPDGSTRLYDATYKRWYPMEMDEESNYIFTSYDQAVEFRLNDSLHLRALPPYYFVSYLSEDTPGWEVYILKPDAAGVQIWTLDADQVVRLKPLGAVDSVMKSGVEQPAVDYYRVNMNDAAWGVLIQRLDWEPMVLRRTQE